MADLAFDSSLVVLIDEEGLTCSDVERRVAGVLTEQGYAKDTFAQAILDRLGAYLGELGRDELVTTSPFLTATSPT